MLPVFFWEFFSETVPPTLAFFQSSICLRFFSRRFFAMSFEFGVRSFRGGFLGPEKPLFRSQKRPEKSSPCLSPFFLEFYFCYAVVLGRFWGTNSASGSGVFLGWFRVRVFVGFLHKLQGVLFAVFGFRCFLGPSLSPSLSAFSSSSSGGRPGCSFSAPLRLWAGHRTSGTCTGGSTMSCSRSFFLSLPGSAAFPSSSALALPLSFSSFSLSLACKHLARDCFNLAGGPKGGHLRGGYLRMGFRSAVRTWTWVFALQGAPDTSILTALVKGIPQGRRRLDREGAV